MSEIKKIGDLMPDLQKRKKTTKAPHEIGDCYGLVDDLGLVSGRYNKGYWFSLLKASGVSFHVLSKEIIPKLKDQEIWVKNTKKGTMNWGACLTNKLSIMAKTRKHELSTRSLLD